MVSELAKRVPENPQNRTEATHLSAREYEHKSCPGRRHPPGEEGPQQGLGHRAVALEHAGYSCVQRSRRGSAPAVPPPELAHVWAAGVHPSAIHPSVTSVTRRRSGSFIQLLPGYWKSSNSKRRDMGTRREMPEE